MNEIISDIDLINKVKNDNDSEALKELINRHTGIYVKKAQTYSNYSHKIQVEEIKEDRAYNIYKWALSYNPDKNMKFSTYVGEMTKYLCLSLISSTPEKVELDEKNQSLLSNESDKQIIIDDYREEMLSEASKMEDKRFVEIFRMRHPLVGKRKTWREIGPVFGLTHERVRQIYEENLPKIKKYIKT